MIFLITKHLGLTNLIEYDTELQDNIPVKSQLY